MMRDGERRGAGWDALRAHRWDAARRAFAPLAEQGDPSACLGLGLLLWAGRGAPRSPTEALALFRRAASSGQPDAQTALAAALGAEDREAARALLTQAAQQGYPPAMAQLAAHADDPAQRIAWARRAAEAGEPDAMALLGRLLARTPARAEALGWLYAAAALGADSDAARDARALARLMLARDIRAGQNQGRALVKRFKAKPGLPAPLPQG
ncbi:MAG: hypothetical protein NW203_05865 [Hyphomonadaceae bacterium]|nr:hypothetical protein [Hyphomonadaceae bacterium]